MKWKRLQGGGSRSDLPVSDPVFTRVEMVNGQLVKKIPKDQLLYTGAGHSEIGIAKVYDFSVKIGSKL